MTSDPEFQPKPAQFKTAMDGLGGLVRVPLVDGLHAGRELYIDEPDVPAELYASPRRDPFEWWPASLQDEMARTALGGDPAAPPIRYVLRIDQASLEPSFVSGPAEG